MGETNESQFLSVIRVWAALAWADDVIAPQERSAMERLIAGADLNDGERATASSWLDNKVELDTANIESFSDKAKEGIYRAALRLAGVDQNVAAEERAFLTRLREGLSLSVETAQSIADSIPSPD